mgnify:FL=1
MAFPSVYEMTNSLTPVTQSSTKTYDQQADGDFVDIWNTNPYIAIKVITGSSAIDTWIEKINMKLYKSGTPAGSAYIRVWDASNNIVESIEFIPNTHLTATSTVYSFILPKPIQLKLNYKVGLQYNGSTSSSNRINARYTPSGTTQSGFSVSTSTNLDAGLTNRNVYMTFDANTTGTALMTNRRRQHFWEYFSGDSLNSRWAYRDLAGTGSSGMSDSVNGGFFVKTATTTGTSQIDFNDIRQFSHTGSVFIGVLQKVTATNALLDSGLITGITHTDTNTASVNIDTRQTYIRLNTGDASANTRTDTDVAIHSNMTSVKIECKAGDIELSLDGILKATKTTNRPTLKMQPYFRPTTLSTPLTEGDISYMECYNT